MDNGLSIYAKRQDYGDVSEKKSHQGHLTKKSTETTERNEIKNMN